MKHFQLLIAGLFMGFLSNAQETWTLDNAHSNIRFEVGWVDFSMRTGEFKIFEGTIQTESKDDLSKAVFNLKVDATSVDVIADRLSDHIKSDKFLDVEKFPDVTFSSSSSVKTSDSTYVSKGKLTIHGVEKEQEVDVWVKGHGEGRRGQILGIQVTLKLNRSDFGLTWGSPRLGEMVTIVGHLLYQMPNKEEE